MTCEAVSDRGDCHVMVLAARAHGVESRYVALRLIIGQSEGLVERVAAAAAAAARGL